MVLVHRRWLLVRVRAISHCDRNLATPICCHVPSLSITNSHPNLVTSYAKNRFNQKSIAGHAGRSRRIPSIYGASLGRWDLRRNPSRDHEGSLGASAAGTDQGRQAPLLPIGFFVQAERACRDPDLAQAMAAAYLPAYRTAEVSRYITDIRAGVR